MVRGRDECVSAYVPDHQWQLLQQSLREHEHGAAHGELPAEVVLEAGLLVRAAPLRIAAF